MGVAEEVGHAWAHSTAGRYVGASGLRRSGPGHRAEEVPDSNLPRRKAAAEEALTKFVVEVGGEVVVDSAGAVRVVGWRVSYAMGPLEMKARIAEMNAERHDVPAIRVRSSTKVGTPDGRPTRPDKRSVGQLT